MQTVMQAGVICVVLMVSYWDKVERGKEEKERYEQLEKRLREEVKLQQDYRNKFTEADVKLKALQEALDVCMNARVKTDNVLEGLKTEHFS